jgi:hypothetical protein
MGVEPTDARCSRPPTDFEDRGTHRGTSTPLHNSRIPQLLLKVKSVRELEHIWFSWDSWGNSSRSEFAQVEPQRLGGRVRSLADVSGCARMAAEKWLAAIELRRRTPRWHRTN